MRKVIFATVVVVGLVAQGCSHSAKGTATEQQLCSDLAAGASTEVLYREANAVNNDLSTGADNLSLEVLAYINAVDQVPGSASVSSEVGRLTRDCQSIGS
jgi:hypothetical protein